MNLVNKEYYKFYNGDTFIVTEFIGEDRKLTGDSECNEHPSCKNKTNTFIDKDKLTCFN